MGFETVAIFSDADEVLSLQVDYPRDGGEPPSRSPACGSTPSPVGRQSGADVVLLDYGILPGTAIGPPSAAGGVGRPVVDVIDTMESKVQDKLIEAGVLLVHVREVQPEEPGEAKRSFLLSRRTLQRRAVRPLMRRWTAIHMGDRPRRPAGDRQVGFGDRQGAPRRCVRRPRQRGQVVGGRSDR